MDAELRTVGDVFYAENDQPTLICWQSNLDVLDQIPDSAVETFRMSLEIVLLTSRPRLTDHHHPGASRSLLSERPAAPPGISHAINREEITKTIFSDTRSPAVDFTSPVVNGWGIEGLTFSISTPLRPGAVGSNAISHGTAPSRFPITATATRGLGDRCDQPDQNTLGIDASGKAYPDFKSLRDEVTNRTITTAFRTGWQADYRLPSTSCPRCS